eukprot:1848348-Rhodomonas_salina.1
MVSSRSVCAIAAFVGLQFAGVDSFATSGAASVLRRAPALKITEVAPSMRRSQFGPSMLSMENRGDRALLMMAQEARAERYSKPEVSSARRLVESVLITALLTRTIMALMVDAVVGLPRAVKNLAKAGFHSRAAEAAKTQAQAVFFSASEMVYDVIEEIAFHFTFMFKFAISAWAAFTLRVETERERILRKIDQVETKLEGYGYSMMRRNSRRPSVTAMGAQRFYD